jgi:predicted ATPase
VSPPRHLETITLRGYKSIRALESFALLPGLNVLIGANGSGKTNFVRFFELLGHMLNRGLQNYVSEHGRADAFLFRGMKVTPEFSAQLAFGLNEYRFTLRAAADRSLFFAQESAPFDGPMHGRTRNDQGSGHLESQIAAATSPSKSEAWVRDTIAGWRVYHFHDTSPAAAVMGLCNIVDGEVLHRDAGNLAAFLLRLTQSHPAHFARIEETVRQVAPFFGTFVLKDLGGGQTQLLWRDRYSELLFYPHQLSDGTLRYICLASLLLQPDPPTTLIIDEPELGLHPLVIKLLASLLHEASQRAQLIVSTQSSQLLDEFSPQDIIAVNHRDGESEFVRQKEQALHEWLSDYTLGQLWEKNGLGGMP